MTRAGAGLLPAAAGLLLAVAASAHDTGNPEEALAMLERAAVEMKSDPEAAIVKFNKGLQGFQDRDLYVFCVAPDGKLISHTSQTKLGNEVNEFIDKRGKEAGKEILQNAKEGEVAQVRYASSRPGESEVLSKVSYITRVAGVVCGVGYYK
jgi:signal transduction histidine kinase